MWSLPDINQLNAEAKRNESRLEQSLALGIQLDTEVTKFPRYTSYKNAVEELGRLRWEKDPNHEREWIIGVPNYTVYWGDKFECFYADDHCDGKLRHEFWYDIFSDDPKGVISTCEYHNDHMGSTPEGYFTCEGCDRLMITNYTWENYYTMVEGAMLCLQCAAKDYVEDEDNWIALTDENIDSLTFDRIRKAKHVIGVSMPVPDGIEFYKNVEFDSASGEKLYSTKQAGVDEIKEYLRDLKEQGVDKALLVLDAAYQFAVSIGIYTATRKEELQAA